MSADRTPVIVDTFKAELLQGVHGPTDTYKVALYTDINGLSATTEVYTDEGEVAGAHYEPGGVVLRGRTVRQHDHTAILTWENAFWQQVTIQARGALIYNASRDNRAVAVIDFGQTVQAINGPFVIEFPLPRSGQGVVSIT